MNQVTRCDPDSIGTCRICGGPMNALDRGLCDRCCMNLLAAPETADEPEPVYSIALAYSDTDLCETRGTFALMETMAQLEPGVYMIREAGVLVADATRRDDGKWIVDFYNGARLSPGCIIV